MVSICRSMSRMRDHMSRWKSVHWPTSILGSKKLRVLRWMGQSRSNGFIAICWTKGEAFPNDDVITWKRIPHYWCFVWGESIDATLWILHTKGPAMRSFAVLFIIGLSKRSSCQWFETPWHPRYVTVTIIKIPQSLAIPGEGDLYVIERESCDQVHRRNVWIPINMPQILKHISMYSVCSSYNCCICKIANKYCIWVFFSYQYAVSMYKLKK